MEVLARIVLLASGVITSTQADTVHTNVIVCQDKRVAVEIVLRYQDNRDLGIAYAHAATRELAPNGQPLCTGATIATQKIGEAVSALMDPDEEDSFFIIPVTYQVSDDVGAPQFDGFMLERIRILPLPKDPTPDHHDGTDT